MKVIFLDIDGVLNDGVKIMETESDFPSKDHLDCLKAIVDATEANIVLSSTWRLFPSARNDVKNALRNVGLEFIDRTKELRDRASEIQEWLSRHPEVEKFVILDDEEISGKFPDNLVQTTFYRGLLPEHAEKAIKILNS
jgi:hypothetical protein